MDAADDDWTLLHDWRDGNDAAGERLARRYFGLLTRFFLNKVRNPDDAADLVSETFLGCTSNRERVVAKGSFRSYLFAVAMNKLRGYYRKQAKRQRELGDFEDVCVADGLSRSPLSMIACAQEGKVLVSALRRLSLDQQIVLELCFFEGLRGPEIAEILGLPTATVYTKLRRGKERLTGLVHELADDPALAESTVMGFDTWARQIRVEIDGHQG
ncbi:RNA polymerase sigma factor [Paraliomyxa miuraensis]|uniref:RNA polymerase sigma factor n=1 Tax=Paraliomyxa miuraensis TaxID=376150 RepID=UPI00225A6DB2|nr:sigma-70 family RNA polymerase sigma factor [Paraliomyxa miuraensis]MCX4242569.1 sigma-70 family RNA polymerase sigma factor [Paraliomyxa miuraensis]